MNDTWIMVLFIALTCGAFLYWLLSAIAIARAKPKTGRGVVDIEMEGAALRAIDEARDAHGVELTPDAEGVQRLDDEILETLHQHHVAGELAKEEFSRNAVLWGAFVGRVITERVDQEARWDRDSELGPGTFPLTHRHGTSFPCGWCVQRITQGADEAVWPKVEALLSESDPSESDPLEDHGEAQSAPSADGDEARP